MKTTAYKRLDTVEIVPFEDNYNITINIFVEETEDENGQKMYVYNSHEFNCKQNSVDISDIKANPEKYIKYNPDVTIDDRVAALEEAILELFGG